MPIYEYRCESCGHQQEFLQKVGDAPVTVCTQCGKPSFSKMVTAAGFQLKGSGWYVTDYGGKSDKSKDDGGAEKGSSEKDRSEKASSEKKDSTAKEDGTKAKDKDSSSKKSESKKSETKKSKD
jgi:putative FmdB family regulatory protein